MISIGEPKANKLAGIDHIPESRWQVFMENFLRPRRTSDNIDSEIPPTLAIFFCVPCFIMTIYTPMANKVNKNIHQKRIDKIRSK